MRKVLFMFLLVLGCALALDIKTDVTIKGDLNVSGVISGNGSGLTDITVSETVGLNLFLSDSSGIETGIVANVVIPYNCTIKEIVLLADQTGSVSVDIWKDSYANYPPTLDDTILPETHPAISSNVKYLDTTLTGWTTSITAGDILTFYIESVANITKLTIYLKLEKTQ